MWTETPRIVVGVDDSPAARWALAWAVGEARLRGLPLLVVHSIRPPRAGYLLAGVPSPCDVPKLQEECTIALRALLSDIDTPPDLDVAVTCPYGHPGETLTRLARKGDLLVVGHSARSLASRLITASVRRYCARRTRATLVMVEAPSFGSLDTAALDGFEPQVHHAGQ